MNNDMKSYVMKALEELNELSDEEFRTRIALSSRSELFNLISGLISSKHPLWIEKSPKKFWLYQEEGMEADERWKAVAYNDATHDPIYSTLVIEHSAFQDAVSRISYLENRNSFWQHQYRSAYKAYCDALAKSDKAFELLQDLNVILPTALHSGHHDLIDRVKEICK